MDESCARFGAAVRTSGEGSRYTLACVAPLLTGATSCSPDEEPTPRAEPSEEPSEEPSAERTPEPEETTEPEEPAQILLTAGAIGDVAIGTPAALPILLELPGPATDDGTGIEQPAGHECGGPGWSSDGSDPAATTVFDIVVNPIACG